MTISETVVPGGQDSGPVVPSRRARLLLLFLPPLLAFVVAHAVDYAASAHIGLSSTFFSPAQWIHRDSHLYLAIADRGYRRYLHCHHTLRVPPHSFCSNAGWLPLYPGMINVLGRFGASLPWAGKYLAEAFALGTLVLAWLLIGPSWSAPNLLALALAAVFPGQVYYFAVFPVSLVAFFSLAFLLLLARRRYVLAGLAGAAAAWAYPTGFLLPFVAVVYTAIADRGRSFADWLERVLPSAGIPALGFAAMLFAYQVWVHAWDAYFLVQAQYGNGLHNPVANFLGSFTRVRWTGYPVQQPNIGYHHLATRAQTVLVAVLVLTLIVAALTVWRRSLTRTDWVILCYTTLIWLFPLTQSAAVSRYRSEALLIPCVALFRRLPVAIQIPFVLVAGAIAVGVAALFLGGKLV